MKPSRRPAVFERVSEVRLTTNGLAGVAVMLRAPLMLRRSHCEPAVPTELLISKLKVPAPAKVVAPTLRIPGLAPGATAPPALTTRGPLNEPVPPKVPPLPTVSEPPPVFEPVTKSLPPLIVAGPEKVLLAPSVTEPADTLSPPVPERTPPKVWVAGLVKLRVPALATGPLSEPPAPICKVPALIVVVPE